MMLKSKHEIKYTSGSAPSTRGTIFIGKTMVKKKKYKTILKIKYKEKKMAINNLSE